MIKLNRLLVLVLISAGNLYGQFVYTFFPETLQEKEGSQVQKIPPLTATGLNSLDLCKGMHRERHASWFERDTLYYQFSADNGNHWLKTPVMVCPAKGAAAYVLYKYLCFGHPSVAVDTGSSNFKGRIYISWSDDKHGIRNKNVFLVYSDDRGVHWTEPILVTYTPNHKNQFHPRVEVDSKTGTVYLAYFDSKNSASGLESDLYLARSSNGGLKFDYSRVTRQSFKVIKNWRPVLTLTLKNSSTLEVIWNQPWIKDKLKAIKAESRTDSLPQDLVQGIRVDKTMTYSLPLKATMELESKGRVSAILTKALDPAFEKVIFLEKTFSAGTHTLVLANTAGELPKDTYILTLYHGHQMIWSWIISE